MAETFDSAVSTLGSNAGIDLVVSDWELSMHSAYDLYLKAGQFTRVADAEEVQHCISFLILVIPGVKSTRHREQMEVLRSIPHIRLLDKPLNRHQLQTELRSLSCGFQQDQEPTTAAPGENVIPVESASGGEIELTSEQREKTRLLVRALGDSLKDVQAKYLELQQIVACR